MSETTPAAIESLKHAPQTPGVEEMILRRWSLKEFVFSEWEQPAQL